jgi:predicted permease
MAMWRRFKNLWRRDRVDQEISDEIQAHLELRIADNLAHGMTADEARREARIRFGNPAATREQVTEADTWLGLDRLFFDVRYAFRQLRRSPGFAATAILTLAFGIGANVVVFGVLNSLLIHPLNVAGADRLYQIQQHNQGSITHSYPDYLDLKARDTTFEDMITYRMTLVGMSAGGQAVRSWAYEVSGNYFDTLGVKPEVGRFFHASDEHGPNSAPFIVLSDATWRSRFGANPLVVGSAVELNKHRYTILGVAPASFHGTENFFSLDFWMPIVNENEVEGYEFLTRRANRGLFIQGVLKPGVNAAQATENLDAVSQQLERENPEADEGLRPRLTRPGMLGDMIGGPAKMFLAAVMGLALLVLAAACVNLAGIFAARAADRSRELAIRLSIGSTRGRIVRQLLTEGLVVSLVGGVAGTGVAVLMLMALGHWQPIASMPIRVAVDADGRIGALALALSIASGLVPSLLPARQVWRTDAAQSMKNGGAQAGHGRRFNLRDLLLGVQIALCALLVTASLVAVRGMERQLHAPLGLEPEGAMLADTDLHMTGASDESAQSEQRRMIEAAARIPGVAAAGTINAIPLSGNNNSTSLYRDGTTDLRDANEVAEANFSSVSPGYFQAAGTRLLAGRDLRWEDGPKTVTVAVINQHLAHLLFGQEPAIGRHFQASHQRIEVVGVVEDGKYTSLTEEPQAAMFYALGQHPDASTTLVVRSSRPTAETAAALSQMLSAMDSSLPFNIQPWTAQMALVLFPAREATAALGVMGLLAALLAVTGIFGMAAYTVSQRMRELGLRVALGAQRVQIMRSALARPAMVLAAGSAVGLGLGILASRLLSYVVYEATPRDPLVLATALVAMVLVGMIATWFPARRALSVNPAQLLRED